ncbi:MAG: hypothetical protein LBC82_09450 [Oscillospiraceae bacterium]|nr:hypothetical protein [Oscillospiraceae bacterium]
MKKGLYENMKKLLAITLITALLLSLAACSGGGAAVTGSGESVGDGEFSLPDSQENPGNTTNATNPWDTPRETPDFDNLTRIPDAASGVALRVPSMWVTEHGAYFVETVTPNADFALSKTDITKSSTLLHIVDSATGNTMVLCSRVTCSHDSEDCGAYLPDEPVEPGIFINERVWVARSLSGAGGGSLLFIDGEHIYALNSGRTFYRLGLDGSGRTEHMKLPEKYNIGGFGNWLMNGKLYMMVSYNVEISEYTYTNVYVILEVDYINKTVREVFEGNVNNSLDVLGLWNGMFYLMETFYPEIGRGDSSPEEIENYLNNQEISIFTLNPETDERNVIFSDVSYGFNSNAYNTCEDGKFIFHSRREESLFRFNVRTGEKTLLADNLPGFIYIQEEIDGRIFLLVDNAANDWSRPYHTVKNELFIYDSVARKITEITLRTKQNMGEDPPTTILYEADGYFYIELEREGEEQSQHGHTWFQFVRSLLGRIPKDDYWVSNADAIEELDWYDQNEWWEMLSENQGWVRTARG